MRYLKKNTLSFLITIFCFFLFIPSAYAENDRPGIRIYLDADQTHLKESAISIEQGIRVALSEINNTVAGSGIELVLKNHRGNTARSRLHLEQFLEDKQALAFFGGLHSPPLLKHRNFINENNIPVLVPWAAATPITRYPSKENWIFRLSIDDSKAGDVIVSYAEKHKKCKSPGLLLENTGWGKANQKTINRALKKKGTDPACTVWFNWGLNESRAKDKIQKIVNANADCILLVANAPEAKNILKAILAFPLKQELSIYSHWGLTGGDFPSVITQDMRQQFDLHFIQTTFSFNDPMNMFAEKVFLNAKKLYPDTIQTPTDIKAPTGFIHAYDLTRLMIAAIKQAGLTDNILKDRDNLRRNLEQLQKPVPGLVKTYIKPFQAFDEQHPDAHEALNINDFVMAHYGPDGEIILDK